ncbi:MAG TPA: hypothetical protein DCP97_03680 [Ruminococcaceae bacterium]|nr:hypothetical protein [Oscillospiraceae bacterium]
MKKIATLIFIVFLSIICSIMASADNSIWASNPRLLQKNCVISVKANQEVRFTADDLERRFGLKVGELKGATVTALPKKECGVLYLGEAPVKAYTRLTRSQLDQLVYIPSSEIGGVITFMPQSSDAVTTNLAVNVLADENTAPKLQGASYATLQNVMLFGLLDISDAEGDPVNISVIKSPQKGSVEFENNTFAYQPFPNKTGDDSFTVVAWDSYGNMSADAVVSISIERSLLQFEYADMNANPSAYAAVKLAQHGILKGEQINGRYFFKPEKQVTRGEFAIMLLSAVNGDKKMPPCVNTGLENDINIESWLKPYIKAAMNLGIIKEKSFDVNGVPTRAEAVCLTDRAARLKAVKMYNLKAADAGEIPKWALQSYINLGAYKMLDLYDGKAHPSNALTKSYAADLIWQLYKNRNAK